MSGSPFLGSALSREVAGLVCAVAELERGDGHGRGSAPPAMQEESGRAVVVSMKLCCRSTAPPVGQERTGCAVGGTGAV